MNLKNDELNPVMNISWQRNDIKMMTGDSMGTAVSIAREVEIGDSKAVSGDEIDATPEAFLSSLIKDTTVFYRVSPRHKLKIVKVSLFAEILR